MEPLWKMTLEATLARIVEMVNKRKSSWLDLSAFISLYLVLWAFPYAGLTLMTKKGWESKANSPNAFDWFTNMGNISVEQVNFGGKPSSRLALAARGVIYRCSFLGAVAMMVH